MSYIYINDINGGQKIFQSSGANDEAIIQQATQALPSQGGTIYFVGTFTLGKTALIDKSNVTWQGQGEATIIKMGNNVNKSMVGITTGGASQLQDINIKDLTLDGNVAFNTSGNVIDTYALVRGYFQNVQIQNSPGIAFVFAGGGGVLDSFWNTVFKCRVQTVGQFGQQITSHENFYNNNIFIDHGAEFYGMDIQNGWSFIYCNKFQRFNAPANTKALISLSDSNTNHIVGNQFNGSPQEIIRVIGNNHIITDNHIRNASNSLANGYPSIYVAGQNNIITDNAFINDVSTPTADIQEVTGADRNIFTNNQLNKGIIQLGTSTIVDNDMSQSLASSRTGPGWRVNAIDMQVTTKSNVWSPGAAAITLELLALKALGATHVDHAIPFNNVAKWALWIPLIRAAGLIPIHRPHFDEWQGDNGTGNIATSTSLTGAGSTATCVTQTPHGLQTGDTVSINGVTQTEYQGEFVVTVVNSTTFTYTTRSGVTASPATASGGGIGWRYGRATYRRKMKAFVIANPTFFADGDIIGGCVEAQEATSSGGNMCFYTQGTTNFDYTLFNPFLTGVVADLQAAFATIGKQVQTFAASLGLSNLNLAGETLDSGDTGNVNGLTNADIVANFNGILSIDHYLSNAYRSGDNYGTKYGSDLDKIHRAFPSCKLMISEWGYPTNAVLSDSEQFLVYQQVIDVLLTKPYIYGVSFWDHHGGTTESLFTDNNGVMVTPGRKATKYVQYAFNSKNAAT